MAGNACIVITEEAFPVWTATSISFGSAEAPDGFDWPVALHASQLCSNLDFDGQLEDEWESVTFPVSDDCPVYIQLLGEEDEPFEIRWFPG